jgi:hypothetical protein
MTKFGLIGAAALSLVLATPAMAMHRHHHHYHYFTLTEPTTTSPAETPLTNSLQGSVGGGALAGDHRQTNAKNIVVSLKDDQRRWQAGRRRS